jgi:hypothetical protein
MKLLDGALRVTNHMVAHQRSLGIQDLLIRLDGLGLVLRDTSGREVALGVVHVRARRRRALRWLTRRRPHLALYDALNVVTSRMQHAAPKPRAANFTVKTARRCVVSAHRRDARRPRR